MDYDYNFGNDYYKYYGNVGVKSTVYSILAPAQSQDVQPGMEYEMRPLPIFDNPNYKGSGKLKNKVQMKILDITTLLGNALQNAYEATRKTSDRYIQVEIVDHSEEIFLSISNTSEKMDIPSDLQIQTSKKDKTNHGFGLKNIHRIVDKYNGKISISCENHIFTVDITI